MESPNDTASSEEDNTSNGHGHDSPEIIFIHKKETQERYNRPNNQQQVVVATTSNSQVESSVLGGNAGSAHEQNPKMSTDPTTKLFFEMIEELKRKEQEKTEAKKNEEIQKLKAMMKEKEKIADSEIRNLKTDRDQYKRQKEILEKCVNSVNCGVLGLINCVKKSNGEKSNESVQDNNGDGQPLGSDGLGTTVRLDISEIEEPESYFNEKLHKVSELFEQRIQEELQKKEEENTAKLKNFARNIFAKKQLKEQAAVLAPGAAHIPTSPISSVSGIDIGSEGSFGTDVVVVPDYERHDPSVRASTSVQSQVLMEAGQGEEVVDVEEEFVNVEEDDDVIIIEDELEPGSPLPSTSAAAAEQQQRLNRSVEPMTLYTVKVEPGQPFQPPRKRHTRDVSSTKRGLNAYYCTCGIQFRSRKRLEPHIRFWNDGCQFQWKFYGQKVSSSPREQRLSGRSSASPEDKMFPCDFPMCRMRFPIFSLLKIHKRTVHDVVMDNRFQIGCRLCGIIFSSRAEFCQHRISVHQTKYGNSSTSGTPSGAQTELLNSSATSNGSVVIAGPSSSTSASTNENVTNSSNDQHGRDKSKPAILGFFCICKKRFATQANINSHINYYKLRRKLTCKICERSFISDAGLKQHMLRSHKVSLEEIRRKKQAPYRCACGKGFYHRKMQEKHYRSHVHKKIFNCTTCNKSFSSERKLNKHVDKRHK